MRGKEGVRAEVGWYKKGGMVKEEINNERGVFLKETRHSISHCTCQYTSGATCTQQNACQTARVCAHATGETRWCAPVCRIARFHSCV